MEKFCSLGIVLSIALFVPAFMYAILPLITTSVALFIAFAFVFSFIRASVVLEDYVKSENKRFVMKFGVLFLNLATALSGYVMLVSVNTFSIIFNFI